MKIAVSSDNHLDVNRVDVTAVLKAQAAYLLAQRVAVYVHVGDSFNDYRKTQAYFRQLQALVAPSVTVRYLLGNHDMLNSATYQQQQAGVEPLLLHEKSLLLPGSNTVLIGNNGWYDYSLAPKTLAGADFAQWKRGFWVDRGIDQPISDAQRMQRVLTTTEAALRAAGRRRVVYLTHFVPRADFLWYGNHRQWQMATALMGSQSLGALLERYKVADVVFGHLHKRHAQYRFGQTHYHHQPVGYGLRRLNEWVSADFMTEWRNTLVILPV